MNKTTLILIFILPLFLFNSCEKETKLYGVVSTVEIAVIKNGVKQPNVTVYMFGEPYTETFGDDPIFAKKQSVTNENGIALFELQDRYDFRGDKTQTTKYFTVLEKNRSSYYSLSGTIGVTLKKGEKIRKTLIIK